MASPKAPGKIDPVIAAIRSRMAADGVSCVELARRAGTSQSTCHGYLAGNKQPGLAVLRRLCRAADLDLEVVDLDTPVNWRGP